MRLAALPLAPAGAWAAYKIFPGILILPYFTPSTILQASPLSLPSYITEKPVYNDLGAYSNLLAAASLSLEPSLLSHRMSEHSAPLLMSLSMTNLPANKNYCVLPNFNLYAELEAIFSTRNQPANKHDLVLPMKA